MPPAVDQPLRFERVFLEKLWGGRRLERAPGFALPPAQKIGETWELVDRAKENSVVLEGAERGRTLGALMRAAPKDLLGRAPAARAGRFPLLIKYIDASEPLSVQVHPDDESAARLGGEAEGKTEAWYVLAAEPGAKLYCGIKPGVARADFERVADGPGVVELLNCWEARAGQCMLVPGGTVHAIGAGLVLLEVQQNSDTTYRLWDWGRVDGAGQPRETHVPRALSVAKFGEPARPPLDAVFEAAAPGLRRAPLARSRHFSMNLLELDAPVRLSTGSQYQIYVVLRGAGELALRGEGGVRKTACTLRTGDTWLVPARADYHYLEPAAGGLALMQVLHRA